MDLRPSTDDRSINMHAQDVFALALEAISVVASRDKPSATGGQRPVQELCDAFVHADDHRRHMVISKLIACGVSSDEIIERYVPEAARRLGEAWVDDTLTFSQVTIGAARLQETVRTLGHRPGLSATIPLGHRILLAIPADEDHTLGAFIAAGQFRRYGVWVHMAIGQEPAEVAETVGSQPFDMVGISGAGRRSLEPTRRLVRAIRGACAFPPPIVVGGHVCDIGADVCECTGADLATTSPRKAMYQRLAESGSFEPRRHFREEGA